MQLTWSNDLPEQGNLRDRWDALVLQMEKPEVFYTWEWAAAVVRAYGSKLQPWIGTAYEGEELVGVVALARPSPTEAVFLAGSTADYCDFLSPPAKRQEFVEQVLRRLKADGIRALILANLPADSVTVAALEGNRCFRSFVRTGYVCAQVQLGSKDERQALTQSIVQKKMLRRSLRSLEQLGPLTLQHQSGDGLRGGMLEAFFSMHVARFLCTGRISNLVSPERRRFLTELARLLSGRGWFDLTSLCAGSRVAGYNYGFRFQGSWFWYQPTLENEFEEFSPGFCLLAKIVEAASQDPDAQVVDLGLGAEGYKERFANAQRTILHVTLSRSAFGYWRSKGRYRATEALKKRAKLESFARRVQSGILRGRQRVRENGRLRTLTWVGKRLGKLLVSQDEVRLYQWQNGTRNHENGPGPVPLHWETLAHAALRYSEDRETLDYLLRSAQRFRSRLHSGYSLLGPDGVAQHFAWVAPYEGFAMAELGETLHAPTPASVMIFDCWTPRELRGQGLYGRTIGPLAARLSAEGKDVWIFSAAANPASVAGIEKAGFEMRFSLLKRKVLAWSKTRQAAAETRQQQPAEGLSKEAVR